MEKKRIAAVAASLFMAGISIFATPVANAAYVNGTEAYNQRTKSYTWQQSTSPWAGLNMGEVNLGSSGCMLFSETEILRKSGARDLNYGLDNFIQEVKASNYAWGATAGGGGAGRLNLADSRGILQEGSGGTMTIDQVIAGVKGGKQYVFAAQTGSGGHWIATDYVDGSGKLVILDSGWKTTKTYDDLRRLDKRFGGTVYQAKSYTLKSGSWKQMDGSGSSSASSTESASPSKSASSPDTKKDATEDELKGMPDKNDYEQNDKSGGIPGDPDVDDTTKKDVAALKDASKSNVSTINGYVILDILAILMMAYAVIILPAAYILERNTVGGIPWVKYATCGFSRLKLPDSDDKGEFVGTTSNGKDVRYITLKGIMVRVFIMIGVAGIILIGSYSDVFLNVWYWALDTFGLSGDIVKNTILGNQNS